MTDTQDVKTARRTASAPTDGSVVWFTMVETATGWIRCGNAYSSREEAEDWLHFVSESRGGRPAKVEKLKLNFINGMLDEETIRTLDEKFNLDAPNVKHDQRGE